MSGFGSTPTTQSQGSLATNQIPISQVAVPGHAGGNLTAMEGGPASTDSNGNETAPVSSYIKDGGDVAQGLTTDTAVTSDANGTVSGKLRGLVKIFASVWDSVHGRLIVDGSQVTQPVSGSVSVSNFPGTQAVSGTVTANQGGSWTVAANSYDQTQAGFIFKPVKNVAITAGTPVAIWTPTTGKKFRLMGVYLNTSNAISGTAILLLDGNSDSNEFFRLSRAQTNNIGTSAVDLWPGGYLSTAINTSLYLDVVGNSSSVVEGTVWGYEI